MPALPVSGPIDAPCFDTMRPAMVAAAHAALSMSERYEIGGAIYSKDGKFCYTLPVTQRQTYEIDYRVALPVGATLAALWHTHPGLYPGSVQTADRLSISDAELAKRMGVPMYIVAIPQHMVVGFHTEGFSL